MGRSLKEALLDQYALLQERGLAPSEVPPDEDAPLVVVESAPRGGRVSRSRRDASDRYGEGDDLDVNGQFDRERRRGQRRDSREEPRERRRPTGGNRGRGRPRELESEFVVSAGPTGGDRARPSGPRPPLGPRPARPGMGAPRPGGPPGPGRPVGRTQIMQQRADQRRRDDEDIAEMRRLLGELSGQEFDDAAMETFSHGLAQETGALPPPRIVVEAIRESQSADPRRIGDAVRAYYRRPRARPAAAPPRTPPTVATPA